MVTPAVKMASKPADARKRAAIEATSVLPVTRSATKKKTSTVTAPMTGNRSGIILDRGAR